MMNVEDGFDGRTSGFTEDGETEFDSRMSSATMRLAGDSDIVWLRCGRKLGTPQHQHQNKNRQAERTSIQLDS